MKITIEQARIRLNANQPVWIYFDINDITEEARHRRSRNGNYAWAYVQDYIMVFCHGYKQAGLISLGVNRPVRVEALVEKFAGRANIHGKRIYVDCCYGANKADTINGIEIIPTNCSYHVTSDDGWYCQDADEFNEFIDKVANVFSGKLMIFTCDYITEEDDFNHHTKFAIKTMGEYYPCNK